MSLVTEQLQLGPAAAGMALSCAEFDAAAGEPGWRYELIQGVLIVTPAPAAQERGPSDLLGHLLRVYQESHPSGSSLDETLPEHDIRIGDDRRRADRVVWAGLGRPPRVDETPTIAIEFVSAGKRNLTRDYFDKRKEYASVGIREYWVFNRFARTLIVYRGTSGEIVAQESESYRTDLLPGFELRLAEIFAAADCWES